MKNKKIPHYNNKNTTVQQQKYHSTTTKIPQYNNKNTTVPKSYRQIVETGK
jgi:hypothetical protein